MQKRSSWWTSCEAQLSTQEGLATSSFEDTRKACVCTVHTVATSQHSCTAIPSTHMPDTTLLYRLRPLLTLSLLLLLLQTASAQLLDQPDIPDRCLNDPDIISCGFRFGQNWRYNDMSGACESYIGVPCDFEPQGEINSFPTEQECQTICLNLPTEVTEPVDFDIATCHLEWEVLQPCSPKLPQRMYRYDDENATCVEFFSYDCDANDNKFPTLQLCEGRCAIPIAMMTTPSTEDEGSGEKITPETTTVEPAPSTHPTTTTTPSSMCTKGWDTLESCTPVPPMIRYRYENESGECVPFVSLGCEVNQFSSREECEEYCPSPITTPPPMTEPPQTTTAMPPRTTTPSTSTIVAMTTTDISTTEAPSTPTVTIDLNKFDYAIIGVGILALLLVVVLFLVVAMVMYRYRKRLKVNKLQVMDSRRVQMVRAYRNKQGPIVLSHDSLTKQTHSYFSAV